MSHTKDSLLDYIEECQHKNIKNVDLPDFDNDTFVSVKICQDCDQEL